MTGKGRSSRCCLRDTERRHGLTLAMKTVFTIHNIAYQGLFPAKTFWRTNLPEELNNMDGLEYYSQINFLKGGILFADRVTTVSPRYAQEIQTPEFGCGLDGVVQTRAEDIVGLLNGVDTSVWNPGTDPLLPARYSAANLAGKKTSRAELLKRCGFDPDFTGPLFGMVCRLVEQKGVDLVLANKDFSLAKIAGSSCSARRQAHGGGVARFGRAGPAKDRTQRQTRRSHEPPD